MSDIQLPNSEQDLTPKELAAFKEAERKFPLDPKDLARLKHGALCFKVPSGFTQEEFQRVGHMWTIFGWKWDEMGGLGKPRWAWIILSLGSYS